VSQKWFGEPWPSAELPSPVCSNPADRVQTPVGESCLHCGEEIASGDRGVVIPYVDWDVGPVTRTSPVHIECHLRSVLGGPGHLLGLCSCGGGGCDPDMGMTPREAALRVWDWVQDEGTV
jgi:hypothetical protein